MRSGITRTMSPIISSVATLTALDDLQDFSRRDDLALRLDFFDAPLWNIVMRFATGVEPIARKSQVLRHLVQIFDGVRYADEVSLVVAVVLQPASSFGGVR
jgi:hypothetical protein